MPRIQRIDIPQLVKVRKYEVDRERLQALLREKKKCVGKSNKTIAEALDVPVTKVEHWFRTDSCFSIPDAELWKQLKSELEIITTEFDEAITTFEERLGVYEKSERCYSAEGIAPTLTSTSAGNEKIIVGDNKMKVRIKKVTSEPNVLRPVRTEYGKQIRKAYESGEIQESRHNMTELHPRTDGITNTLTTVQKDNYLHDGGLRIRKLTPKECFRLMGFDDTDFEKAEAVNSNTQLYKQAGNSIVVPVVQNILKSLIDCGVFSEANA